MRSGHLFNLFRHFIKYLGVLAYSGGLDTSVILRWLQETYDCEVVTFTADLGQGEELEPARRKAQAMDSRSKFLHHPYFVLKQRGDAER